MKTVPILSIPCNRPTQLCNHIKLSGCLHCQSYWSHFCVCNRLWSGGCLMKKFTTHPRGHSPPSWRDHQLLQVGWRKQEPPVSHLNQTEQKWGTRALCLSSSQNMKAHRHMTHSATGRAPPEEDKKQFAEFKKHKESHPLHQSGGLREQRRENIPWSTTGQWCLSSLS